MLSCGKMETVMDTEKKFLTLKEAAKYLDVSHKTIYGMVERGIFTKYKPAGKIYVKVEELEKFLEEKKTN